MCACLFFLRAPASSYPERQREGFEQGNIFDTCHSVFQKENSSCSLGKWNVQPTLPLYKESAVTWWLTWCIRHGSFSHVIGPCSLWRWCWWWCHQEALGEVDDLCSHGSRMSRSPWYHWDWKANMLLNFFRSFPCLSFFFPLSSRTFKWSTLEKDYMKQRINW